MDALDTLDTPRARKRSSSARPRMQRAAGSTSAPGADYGLNTLDAKVVILGRQGVGKTSLVRRYTSNTFHPPSTQSTTGAFFVTKKCTVDGVGVRLQIWDTAGQERFRSMAPMYIRGANAAIVVYDLTSERSFEDVRMWIDELKKSTPPSLLVYVVGSKSDLCPAHRAVTPSSARAALLRWYPPPPPPPNSSASTSKTSTPPGRRQRLISLPTMPVSKSVPALAAMAKGGGAGMSLSGPPTPGAHAPKRPRLVSSPSSPTTYTNGHSHSSSRPPAPRARPTSSSLAPPHPPHTAPPRPMPHPAKRPWSWTSSPDEKDESAPPLLARVRVTAYEDGDLGAHEVGEWSESESVVAEVRSEGALDEEDEDDEDIDEDDDNDDSEPDKGNWELFEVSAKDDIGIQSLFNHLIHSLLARRELISYEHELRRKGSVMLRSDSAPASIVGGPAGRREEEGWGWGCCGI